MATALETNVLEAQPRQAGTKNDAKRVRRDGKIPAVVYGAGKDSLSISVDPRVVTRILNSESGHNTIFDLTMDGEKTKAMIVDWQYEPIKGRLLHIDLKRIALDKVLTVSVPIFLVGEAAGECGGETVACEAQQLMRGYVAEHGRRSFARAAVAGFLAEIVLFVGGLSWLAVLTHSVALAFRLGLYWFVFAEVIKVMVAAGIAARWQRRARAQQ